jgi:hypothetical protein
MVALGKTRRTLRLILLVLVALGIASCALGDNTNEVTLEAGTASEGPDGMMFRAQSDSIEEPLELTVEREEPPLRDVSLPDGVETRGAGYRITPERSTVTDPEAPFLVGLPIPEQADLDHVAVAVVVQPDEYTAQWNEEGPPADYEPTRQWSIQEAYIAQGTVATTVPNLQSEEGRLMVVVEEPTFRSIRADSMQVRTHSDEGFDAVCLGGFDDADESCPQSAQVAAEDALEEAYHEVRGDGFPEPALSRRVNVVPQLFNSDLSLGPYLIRLRPCSKAEKNYKGLYKFGSDRAWVCLDEDDWGNSEMDAVRHEYFHASQHAIEELRKNADNARDFVIEGQAVASEESYDGLERQFERRRRPIDISLTDNHEDQDGELVAYQAQDFWIFLGERLGTDDLGYMKDALQEGGKTYQVDDMLAEMFPGGLRGAYWAWVKNYAFEGQYESVRSFDNETCQFNPESVDDLEQAVYLPGLGLDNDGFTLDPMTAEVVEFTVHGADEPRIVRLSAIDTENDDRDIKFYRDYSVGTEACWGPRDGYYRVQNWIDVPVDPGDSKTVYALVANDDYDSEDPDLYRDPAGIADNQRTIELHAESREVDLSIDIETPSDGDTFTEGLVVPFEADVTASEGVRGIEWRAYRAGSSEDVVWWGWGRVTGAGLLCNGDLTVEVEVTDERGLDAKDQVSFTIENQKPTLSFRNTPLPDTIGSGDYLLLEAKPEDHDCTSGPNDNAADPDFVQWYIDGQRAGTGGTLATRVEANPGETVEVRAEYRDFEGALATAGPVELDVTEPPPRGYAPKLTIIYPREDAGVYQVLGLTLGFIGRAYDAEDGRLTGESLQWTVRNEDGETLTGTGETPEWTDVVETGFAFGTYDVTFSARDSDGNLRSKSIVVNHFPGI